jgi:hypothetical protein
MLRGRMPSFNLAQAAEVLRSKYNMNPIQVFESRNAIEGDVHPSFGDKMLIVELSVSDRGIGVLDIKAAKIRPALEPLDFQEVTASYQTRPDLVKYLDGIKRDIGLA